MNDQVVLHDEHVIVLMSAKGERSASFLIGRDRWVNVTEVHSYGEILVGVSVSNETECLNVKVGNPASYEEGVELARDLIRAVAPFNPAMTDLDRWAASARAALEVGITRQEAA